MGRELKPCGTEAAHRRHLRAGEEPCEPCRDAHAADMAERRRLSRGGRSRDELPVLVVPAFAGEPGDRLAVLRWLREMMRAAVDFTAAFDPGRLAATTGEFRAVLAEVEAVERVAASPDPFAEFLACGCTQPAP